MTLRDTATVVPEGVVARVSCETACDDYDVLLAPGTYPVRYMRAGFQECAPDSPDAYWAVASIPAVRLHDGTRWGKKGEPVLYHMQRWVWYGLGWDHFRKAAADAR